MMQRIVAICHKVNMGCGRKRNLSLLDSDIQITLICQSYFEWEILPQIITSSRGKAEAHQLFQLTGANNGKLPMPMYVELDLDILGVLVPKMWGSYYPRAQWAFRWAPLNQTACCHQLEHDKICLSGVYSKSWIKEPGTFWQSNRCKSLLFPQHCVFHHTEAGGWIIKFIFSEHPFLGKTSSSGGDWTQISHYLGECLNH